LWNDHERKQHRPDLEIWRRHSSRTRTDLGAPRRSFEWTSKPHLRLVGVPESERQRDLLDVAWISRLKEATPSETEVDLRKGFWCDLSQSVLRKPWSSRLRNFKSRGHLYSYEKDRCLSGSDQLRVLGWPKRFFDGVSQCEQLNLSEYATSMPLTCMLELCLWANPYGSWHSGPNTITAHRKGGCA